MLTSTLTLTLTLTLILHVMLAQGTSCDFPHDTNAA